MWHVLLMVRKPTLQWMGHVLRMDGMPRQLCNPGVAKREAPVVAPLSGNFLKLPGITESILWPEI
eukprot:334765-Chlamydomonas_euryale.AAC.3